MNGTFRFHPVGQGLFYSGLINAMDLKCSGIFSFVYDCGSTSSRSFLYREIDDFKTLLPHVHSGVNRKLDMLIISHLHDDHVNGLEYLLNGVDLDTVVMPYTDSITRFLARTDSLGEEEFLNSFYADPVGWFVSRGVHRILLIGSQFAENYKNKEEEQNRRWKYDRNGNINNFEIDGIIDVEKVSNTDVFYLDHNAQVESRLFFWKFKFSNLKLYETESYMHIVDEFQRKNLVTLNDIFHNKRLTQELKKCLKKSIPNGKTVNRTSVVAIHEPILNSGERIVFQSSNPYLLNGVSEILNDLDNKYLSKICKRTILTGDIEIMEDETIPLKKDIYYGCAVFQYPHHGAKEIIPNRVLSSNMFNIFSIGIANRYGHPNSVALVGNKSFFIVNERMSFDYIVTVIR